MPTLLSHPAVPLGLGLVLGSRLVPPRLVVAGVVGSVLPDIDVIGFQVGISYAHSFGHRGFTHSIVFATLWAFVMVGLLHRQEVKWWISWGFIVLATMSHGLLDMMTNGGLGIALWWPVHTRYFFPWQPIEVSPIGLSRFLTQRGLNVLQSELLWIWLPVMFIGLIGWGVRNVLRRV